MTSCSSSVSVPIKSTNSDEQRSKSCDSVCTTNSSCYLQRRKPKNPLMYSNRTNYPKYVPVTNAVRQRVLSAKLLKLRSIQSQLNDANYHLSELTKENQILKNLQKRQDKALSKYENTNADLPRLIRGHEEQIRTLTEKSKTQRNKIRELTELVKIRDDELLKMQEKLSHLEKLSKDKRLVDREKMFEQIEELKLKLQRSEEVNSVLNRKLALEEKTSKQRLNAESLKFKQSQKELMQALAEVDRLSGLLETKENVVHPRKNRFSRLNGQSVSMVTLGSYPTHKTKSKEKLATIEDNDSLLPSEKTPVSNIKLEPIKCRPEESSKKSCSILNNIPSESIKNRLSSSGSKSRESGESNFSDNGSELSLINFDISDDTFQSKSFQEEVDEGVNKLDAELEAAIKKAEANVDDEFEKKLGNYCSDVMTNVRECTERVEAQKEGLKVLQEDTHTILETFSKTQKLEKKLKSSFFNYDPLNDDFLGDILTDKNNSTDRNGNIKKEAKFGAVDRKKLLETLKAIDDGDSFDSYDTLPSHKKNYSREIDELIG